MEGGFEGGLDGSRIFGKVDRREGKVGEREGGGKVGGGSKVVGRRGVKGKGLGQERGNLSYLKINKKYKTIPSKEASQPS